MKGIFSLCRPENLFAQLVRDLYNATGCARDNFLISKTRLKNITHYFLEISVICFYKTMKQILLFLGN